MNNLHEQFTDQEFIAKTQLSNSVTSLMKSLGYKATSSYPKYVKPRLDRLGISILRVSNTKFSNEDILKVANGASSVMEIMRKLNMCSSGYGHARFKNRLKQLGIEFKEASAWSRGKTLEKQRGIQYYLVKDGPFINSSLLRKLLILAGLKNEKCEICENTEWMGQRIPLQLDHKDGDRTNNLIDNLRVLCANCHCQTPTHSIIKSRRRQIGKAG